MKLGAAKFAAPFLFRARKFFSQSTALEVFQGSKFDSPLPRRENPFQSTVSPEEPQRLGQ
jgi:hypothetical protein